MMHDLGQKHPNGFVLLKIGSSSSGLAASASGYTTSGAIPPNPGQAGIWVKSASNENYQNLIDSYQECVRAINDEGKQADLRGIFVSLGHNDCSVAGGAAGFAAAINGFCTDLREDFGTRTSSGNVPIIWRRPQADIAGLNQDDITTVRNAIVLAATNVPNFSWVDADGLERDRDDQLHETPETAVIVGRRMVEALGLIAF